MPGDNKEELVRVLAHTEVNKVYYLCEQPEYAEHYVLFFFFFFYSLFNQANNLRTEFLFTNAA